MKRTPLKPRSKKTQALYKVRVPLVRELLEEYPLCQRCLMARSVDAHELITRARGGSIIDKENMVALCRECHNWIHTHSKQAGEWLRRRDEPKPRNCV